MLPCNKMSDSEPRAEAGDIRSIRRTWTQWLPSVRGRLAPAANKKFHSSVGGTSAFDPASPCRFRDSLACSSKLYAGRVARAARMDETTCQPRHGPARIFSEWHDRPRAIAQLDAMRDPHVYQVTQTNILVVTAGASDPNLPIGRFLQKTQM